MKEKQKQIYETVLKMIASGMPEAEITISEIARRSSIGKGTVYEYFTSKRELFLSTAQYFAREALFAMKACYKGESFQTELSDLLYNAGNWFNRCRSLFFFLFLGKHITLPYLGGEPLSDEWKNLFAEIHREGLGLTNAFVNLGQKEGFIRKDLELYQVLFACASVLSIFGLVDAGKEELLGKKLTQQEICEEAYDILLRILR